MGARQAVNALLLGADDSLAALLSDVLAEVGIVLQVGEARVVRPDLVLVQMGRGESLLSVLQSARDGTYPAPVVVLLPFADEPMRQRALRLGARGCFALGEPIDELRRMVLAVLPAPRRSTPVAVPRTRASRPGGYDE